MSKFNPNGSASKNNSKESRGSGGSVTQSQWDLLVDSHSHSSDGGYVEIDDNSEDHWNALHGRRWDQSLSSHGGLSSKSSANNRSDRVFYEDMDLVTDSQNNFKFHKKGGEFELERWWLQGFLWQRIVIFLLIIFVIIILFHLGFGIYCLFLAGEEWDKVPDPYVCTTPGCEIISSNLIECINASADPCEDFYQYGCGGYTNDDEDPDAISSMVRLTHAFEILSASVSTLSKMLKQNGRGDTTDKLIEFYKACIDERKRVEIGIDPLLNIIRTLSPSAFGDNVVITAGDMSSIQDSITFGKLYHETGLFRIFLLPDHTIALTRPQWLQEHSRTFEDILLNSRAAYQLHVTSLFTKLWARMGTLGLIQKPPYPAAEAGELVLIMMNGVINYLYNPKVPIPTYAPADAKSGRSRFESLLKGILDDTTDPLTPPTFKVLTSEIPDVRHVFGSWEDDIAGSLVILYAPNGRMFQDLTSKRVPPRPDSEFPTQLFRALHAFRIFLLFSRYSGVIRPEQWSEYGLDKVYPEQFKQDSQRSHTLDVYCLKTTVSYLNEFTQVRLFKLLEKDKLAEMEGRMNELHIEALQSLGRWYALKERAGELSPRLHTITQEFLSINTAIITQFPLPELTKEKKERLKRRVKYLDSWQVDPENFLNSIQEMTELMSTGRLKDWRNNAITPGENHEIKLEYVTTSPESEDSLTYFNRINFPFLLLQPPYLLNNMSVFDYAGTAIYMARAELQLWLANTEDPGGLRFPAGLLEGLGPGTKGSGVTECKAVTSEDLSGNQGLKFTDYMTLRDGEGLNTLAIKVAYDLYKHPEQFGSLIDTRTGDPARIVFHKNGWVEFIGLIVHANGSTGRVAYTGYPNRTFSFRPYDTRRFVLPEEYYKYRLAYKTLINLGHYTQDQLFFLHSINSLCYTAHGRGIDRFDRYTKLLNGVYQQLDEFAEAFGCKRNSPMNPSNKCFRETGT